MSENTDNGDTSIVAEEECVPEVNEVNDSDNSQSATTTKRSWLKGKKRPAEPLSEEEVAQIQLKRIRQRIATTPRSALNAVMVLNEYRKQLNYEVINVSGPVHVAHYTVRVEVDGLVFEGSGNGKKKAKMFAAEAAINALFGDIQPPPDVVASSSESCNKETDCETVPLDSCVNGVNPTIVLNRLRPGTSYVDAIISNIDVLTSSVDNLTPIYRLSCVIDDVTYVGTGLSKKVARANAAAEALEKGFGITCTRTSSGFPVFVGEVPPISSKSKVAKGSAESQCPPPPAKQTEPLPQLLCSLPGNKTAIMLLHELYPTVEFIQSDTVDENNLFHSAITVEERLFEGKGLSKKLARTSVAIQAVNYLHQTGYLNMRLAEKASQKKPKWQPPQKAQFSQETVGRPRGGFSGQRGRGRGRGAAGRGGNLYKEIKDSSWIAGGILKAGDFLGLNKAGAAAAKEASFASGQDYYQQAGYSSDDSYMTANSSFATSFTSPRGNFQGSSAAYSSFGTTPGSLGKQNPRFNRSVGSELTSSTAPKAGSGIGRGKTWAPTQTSSILKNSPVKQSAGVVGVKKLMDFGYQENSPGFSSQFNDRKPGGFVSSTAAKKPTAVVKLSEGYSVLPGVTAHVISAPVHQPHYAGYEYSYADYGQGFGGVAENAAYSGGLAGLNPGTALDYTDYGQFYTQYDASGYGNYTT